MTQKGEALKPNYSELQKIEADYDPEKDVITVGFTACFR